MRALRRISALSRSGFFIAILASKPGSLNGGDIDLLVAAKATFAEVGRVERYSKDFPSSSL